MLNSFSQWRSTYSASSSVSERTAEEEALPGERLVCYPHSQLITRNLKGIRAQKKNSVINRRKKSFIPDDKKDSSYWDKRNKNNEAAKRSREKRRVHDLVMEGRLASVIEENAFLKSELMTAKLQREMIKDPTPYPALYCNSLSPFVPGIWSCGMWPSMVPSGLSPTCGQAYRMACNLHHSPSASPRPSNEDLMLYHFGIAPRSQNATDMAPKKDVEFARHSFTTKSFLCEDDGRCSKPQQHVSVIETLDSKRAPYKLRFQEPAGGDHDTVVKSYSFPISTSKGLVNDFVADGPQFAPFLPSPSSAFRTLPNTGGQGLKRNQGTSWRNVPSLEASAFPESAYFYPVTTSRCQSSALDNHFKPMGPLGTNDAFKNNRLCPLNAEVTQDKRTLLDAE
ncbi:uncharacterized protein [Ambystoma mexicanum]|uniref:uncharacterized protein n=1 Tax=Ambystoma mexicanum TaxID=8296 RepID=UPI0037E8694C